MESAAKRIKEQANNETAVIEEFSTSAMVKI
jgi:hypothetical protein